MTSATRAASGLADLVGDVDAFFTKVWAQEPTLFHVGAAEFGALIDEEEIWAELRCGLLSRPYFTVFNEGVRAAIADITETRDVVGHSLIGFADHDTVRQDFDSGATFKLNQVEHWHPRISSLVESLKSSFDGELEAFVFLSPPDRTAMQAHTDGAHVLVLQLWGTKDWVVGRLNETSHSLSTLHEGEIAEADRLELTLHPGDVLYMPHGCPHYATARDGNSIHLAITIEEPSAVDLANVYLAGFLRTPAFDHLTSGFHTLAPEEVVCRMRAALSEYLEQQDPARATRSAISLRKG